MRKSIAALLTINAIFASCMTREVVVDKPGGASASPKPGCLNLNSATSEQLTSLAGVGEVMARRIVEYREKHGAFRRSQDLIIVEGFSETKYAAVADKICVE